MSRYDVIVVGAGHNGLACACYLARAGLGVLVLERADRIGGAVHTAETIPEAPEYRFDTCSVVHNLINMTSIREELQLDAAGLSYAEAGRAPSRPAVYLYTPSAIDPTVAPPGRHGAYVACASYPARFADGTSWQQRGAQGAQRLLDAVEARAPGFTDSITGLAWRHAEDWEREIGLLGGHPMHLDITQDQVGSLRPLPELADHRSPVPGLYLTGAGTAPAGGVAAVPGREAARALLRDLHRPRRIR